MLNALIYYAVKIICEPAMTTWFGQAVKDILGKSDNRYIALLDFLRINSGYLCGGIVKPSHSPLPTVMVAKCSMLDNFKIIWVLIFRLGEYMFDSVVFLYSSILKNVDYLSFVWERSLADDWDDEAFFFSTYSFNPDYTAIAYFVAVTSLIALLLLILPLVLKPSTPSFEKNSSYECGFEPFVCKNESFESHFLIVGVLFLLFDLELIFLFPLVAIPASANLFVLLAIIPFLIMLFFGFLFEWLRGALLWPIFYSKREEVF